MQPDNTIGVVQWGRTFTGTDGERISFIITAYFQAHHVPYLNDVLASRLEALLGPDVDFRLDPGESSQTPTSARYEPGYIVITGLTEPWPNGTELREVIDSAFREAGEVEAEQIRRANEMVHHLKATGLVTDPDYGVPA